MLKNGNILQKEQEFLKLNEEIDSRTKDLLTQVNYIKEIQSDNDKFFKDWEKQESLKPGENDILEEDIDKTHNDTSSPNNRESPDSDLLNTFSKIRSDTSLRDNLSSGKSSVRSTGLTAEKNNFRKNGKVIRSAKTVPLVTCLDQESSLSLGSAKHKSDFALTLGNEVIPETLKEVGQEGIMRFLTAKVKLLTEQVEKMQKEEKKNLEKIKELQTQNQKFSEENKKLLHQVNNGRSLLVKQEHQLNSVVDQLKLTVNKNNGLKKELDALKSEVREINKSNSSAEVRLHRALEEAEKLKSTIQQLKHENKELTEMYKKKNEELANEVKSLDRQRNELMSGFKKQMLIIDNLQQQKELVEAARMIKMAKEDFLNFLDSNPQDLESSKNLKSRKS